MLKIGSNYKMRLKAQEHLDLTNLVDLPYVAVDVNYSDRYNNIYIFKELSTDRELVLSEDRLNMFEFKELSEEINPNNAFLVFSAISTRCLVSLIEREKNTSFKHINETIIDVILKLLIDTMHMYYFDSGFPFDYDIDKILDKYTFSYNANELLEEGVDIHLISTLSFFQRMIDILNELKDFIRDNVNNELAGSLMEDALDEIKNFILAEIVDGVEGF